MGLSRLGFDDADAAQFLAQQRILVPVKSLVFQSGQNDVLTRTQINVSAGYMKDFDIRISVFVKDLLGVRKKYPGKIADIKGVCPNSPLKLPPHPH